MRASQPLGSGGLLGAAELKARGASDHGDAVAGLTGLAFHHLAWLEKEISNQFLCGPRFTLADILLFSFLTFADSHGNPIDKDLKRIWAWVERVGARPTMTRL